MELPEKMQLPELSLNKVTEVFKTFMVRSRYFLSKWRLVEYYKVLLLWLQTNSHRFEVNSFFLLFKAFSPSCSCNLIHYQLISYQIPHFLKLINMLYECDVFSLLRTSRDFGFHGIKGGPPLTFRRTGKQNNKRKAWNGHWLWRYIKWKP